MAHRTGRLRAALAGGAALALVMGASAQAKPTRHHHRPAGPSQSELELKAQVDALKAQVQSLETRLDAQGQTQT